MSRCSIFNIRCSIFGIGLEYQSNDATLTYHSDKPTGPTAGSETLDALEFLARVVSHIPNKGQVLQRYYGWYANRTRGIRRRAGAHEQPPPPAAEAESEPPSLPEARRRWAELLRRIFEVDPLQTQPRVIDQILTHLRRTATEPRVPSDQRRRSSDSLFGRRSVWTEGHHFTQCAPVHLAPPFEDSPNLPGITYVLERVGVEDYQVC